MQMWLQICTLDMAKIGNDLIWQLFSSYHSKNRCAKPHCNLYQSPLILTELFQHNLINVSYLTACYLYQVMMTLHFSNDVANDA